MFIFQENNSCSNARNQTIDKLQHKCGYQLQVYVKVGRN
jgi:hypothetical protein